MEEQFQKNRKRRVLKANSDKGVPDEVQQKTPSGGTITYCFRYNTCGKVQCSRCQEGTRHGPYWYAYFRYSGKYIACYIGSLLTPDIAKRSIEQKFKDLEQKQSSQAQV